MKVGRLLLGALLVASMAGVGAASEIQCKRILKYLDTGRTASEVAETMVISEDDVVRCQEEAKEAEGGSGSEAPSEDAKD
jgi:hypothetical protein